ncbi:MAG: TRAP transporter substrate-binding protein, partial [Burkholderiaceae bacterium]
MQSKLNRLTRLLGGLSIVTGVALGAATANAADVTLRMHHFLPPQANVPKLVLEEWANNVNEASAEKVKVRIFPAMQLGGKPPELMDQAKDGIADIVWTVVGYTPGRFPRTEVFELPFMMTDAESTSRAFWDLYQQEMEKTEFKDLKILGTWVHGPGLIHASKPISLPADLAGVKIRGGSRVVNQLLEKLGATPVGMPVPAVAEGLSKGVIDATTIPWEVTRALKVPELVKNHTEFGDNSLYTLTFVLAMNKAKYESLSPELQKAIDASSGAEFSA